jgi:hypothetical protein
MKGEKVGPFLFLDRFFGGKPNCPSNILRNWRVQKFSLATLWKASPESELFTAQLSVLSCQFSGRLSTDNPQLITDN